MSCRRFMGVLGTVGLTLLLLTGSAQAGRWEDPVARRLDQLEDQLHWGIRSGALTPPEARKLAREQQRLEQQAAVLRADGRLTPKERYWLDHKLDQAERRMYRESHDRQTIWSHPHGRRPHWQERHRPGKKAWHSPGWHHPKPGGKCLARGYR